MPRRILAIAILTFLSGISSAQEILTNESILKLVKAGLGPDLIVTMVESQPGAYSVGADGVLKLKTGGVPDKVIAAMVKKSTESSAPRLPAPTNAPVNPIGQPAAGAPAAAWGQAAAAPVPTEMGVYFKKDGAWTELLPEVVNWKTGGAIKNLASAGIVKKDVNGLLNGRGSRNSISGTLEFLVNTAEGVAITEYQLIRLRPNDEYREFRTVTGGVFNQKGGAMRDIVPFEGKKLGSRSFSVILPNNLGAGEYGFLPPGALPSGSTSPGMGAKMYTFRLIE